MYHVQAISDLKSNCKYILYKFTVQKSVEKWKEKISVFVKPTDLSAFLRVYPNKQIIFIKLISVCLQTYKDSFDSPHSPLSNTNYLLSVHFFCKKE